MKKKINYIMFFMIIFTLCIYAKCYARITTNDPTVNSGETVTITINSQEGVASGAIDISSNTGLIFKSVSGGTANGTKVAFAASENKTSGIAKYTFTAPTVSTTTTYKVQFTSADMADENGNSIASSTATATVTVKAKETTPPSTGGSTGGSSGGTTGGGNNTGGTTTKPTAPTFKDVSKTVYATGDINLRSSWSRESSATRVSKGTELKLTGTSTEKVNGYVWYRVTYNGQIKYVAKDLITETKPEEKENNAKLKTLAIEGVELTPAFSADVTEYSIKLVDFVETEINIKAEAESEKSAVKIEGNTNLIVGENIITITVTAEDGTTKIYTITAVKESSEAFGLTSLVIKDVELKNFSTEKYDYEVSFEGLDRLEIEAIPSEEGATIEILGNENLVEGESLITIIVTSADGSKTATYQIKATKLATTLQEEVKEINMKAILISALVALIVVVIIVILIIKYVKNNNTPVVDYEYHDNLDDEPDQNDTEFASEIIPKTDVADNSKETNEDEIFAEDLDETPRRRGKGKHSK